MTARGTLVIPLLSAFPAAAADPPMFCFGNEPSWGLHFADAGNARVQLPDAPPVEYRGSATRLDFIHEQGWRGTTATGGGGDLVAFLRQEREFLAAYQSATTWGFMGGMLDMNGADSERVLTADAD